MGATRWHECAFQSRRIATATLIGRHWLILAGGRSLNGSPCEVAFEPDGMDRSLLITASMGQGGTFDHQQSKQGGSEDAGYYGRDRSGKERVPSSRLRCTGQAGVAQATRAAAAPELRRQSAAVPGGDGGLRERALLGA